MIDGNSPRSALSHEEMPKRILVVNHHLRFGGIATSLLALLRYLETRNCEITLLLWDAAGPLRDSIPEGVKVAEVRRSRWAQQARQLRQQINVMPLRSCLKIKGLRAKASALLAYTRYRMLGVLEAKSLGFLVVDPPEGDYDAALAFSHFGFSLGYVAHRVPASTKLSWYHHGDYSKKWIERLLDAGHYAKLDALVAVSKSTASIMRKAHPLISKKIKIIPNLLDVTAIQRRSQEKSPSPLSERSLRIVTVSRMSAEKGVDIAIEAALQLKQSGITFDWYLVGDGPLREDMQRRVDAAGANDHVHFLGEMVNPLPIVAEADIFVQPSRIEADGLTVKEALSLGRVVVATDIEALRDTLSSGRFGVLCPPHPQAFADAIFSLADAQVRARAKAAAETWSWDNEKIEQDLDRLLGW